MNKWQRSGRSVRRAVRCDVLSRAGQGWRRRPDACGRRYCIRGRCVVEDGRGAITALCWLRCVCVLCCVYLRVCLAAAAALTLALTLLLACLLAGLIASRHSRASAHVKHLSPSKRQPACSPPKAHTARLPVVAQRTLDRPLDISTITIMYLADLL
jgi:hypothetical protein